MKIIKEALSLLLLIEAVSYTTAEKASIRYNDINKDINEEYNEKLDAIKEEAKIKMAAVKEELNIKMNALKEEGDIEMKSIIDKTEPRSQSDIGPPPFDSAKGTPYDFDFEENEDDEGEMYYYDYEDEDEEDESFGEYNVEERAKKNKDRIMNLYSAEGFEYVGKEDIVAYEEENLEIGEFDNEAIEGLSAFDGPVARITTGGDLYTAPSAAGLMANDKDEVKKRLKPIREQKKKSSLPPNFEKIDGQTVIGRDTRFQVPLDWRVAGWPFWRVARVCGSSSCCSGTIVGYNKVLTNAHCVYNRNTGKWTVPRWVAPGENGRDFWGKWNVRHATLLTKYIYTGGWIHQKYDYAILTMKNDNWTRKHIGQYMGYFPMQDVHCSVLDREHYKKRIVGYPEDKPSGTMWDSGQCDAWYYSCGSKMAYHKCDTLNSGSGMLLFYSDWTIRVIGAHAFGTYNGKDDGWNSGPAFEGGVARMLRRW